MVSSQIWGWQLPHKEAVCSILEWLINNSSARSPVGRVSGAGKQDLTKKERKKNKYYCWVICADLHVLNPTSIPDVKLPM